MNTSAQFGNWPRSNPAELAEFDPESKVCTMNCGPHGDDPRSGDERKFQCLDCSPRQPAAAILPTKPKCPRRSKKAILWRRYYEGTATWFADMAINLAADFPAAAALAQTEADRFCAGARELREGRHANQISGEWK